MAIDYQRLRAWTFDDRVDRYTARDCMIYALGLGYGGDPLDEAELRYVHEQDTAVAPTFLATVGAPNGWAADPATGIDWLRILHGEHRMAFHAPCPRRPRCAAGPASRAWSTRAPARARWWSRRARFPTPAAASRWPPSSTCRSAAPMAASARATNRRRRCRHRRSARPTSPCCCPRCRSRRCCTG